MNYKQYKIAAYHYTPTEWRKYTTPEERKALADMERVLSGRAYKAIILQGGLIGGYPAGLLASALTPTWDIDTVQRRVRDYGSAKGWIPGYNGYINGKLLGAQRAVQRRVEELAKKHEDEDRRTEESYKDKQ